MFENVRKEILEDFIFTNVTERGTYVVQECEEPYRPFCKRFGVPTLYVLWNKASREHVSVSGETVFFINQSQAEDTAERLSELSLWPQKMEELLENCKVSKQFYNFDELEIWSVYDEGCTR